MLLLAVSGWGASMLYIGGWGAVVCVVVVVPVLLPGVGSVVALPGTALSVIVEPLAVFELTLTTRSEERRVGKESGAWGKATVPEPQGAVASVRVQPAGVVTDTNGVVVGTA